MAVGKNRGRKSSAANGKVPDSKKAIAPDRPVPAKKQSRSKTVARNRTEQAPNGPRVTIFQIYFEEFQRGLLDPNFTPLDNQGTSGEYLEFEIFNRLFLSDHVKEASLWGALSWRFTEKTGLSGADLLRLIEENPGYDIYYCNPYPKHEALFHNLWVQGETAHPDFLSLSQAFLSAAGLPIDDTEIILPPHLYCSANFFVATPRFWRDYLEFVNSAIARAEKVLPAEIRKRLHSADADDRNLHAGASYMPFIVERLFPLFLRSMDKGLKAFQIRLPLVENELDVHLQLLRQMKQFAHDTKSPWLAACWANYRSLYFKQLHGEEWTRRYLRAITPAAIKFA